MRIEVVYRSEALDGRAARVSADLAHRAGGAVGRVNLVDVYLLDGLPEVDGSLAAELFSDPVAQRIFCDDEGALLRHLPHTSLAIEVASRAGVTDPLPGERRLGRKRRQWWHGTDRRLAVL